MYGVPKQMQTHAAWNGVQAHLRAHCQQEKQHEQRNATSDGKNLENAQTGARQFPYGHRHDRK
jgi:hypothetical protein